MPSSNCTGDISLTGTVTTDILGPGLTASNLTDWDLTFSSENHPATVLTPANSISIFEDGATLTATPTELSLVLPEQDNGLFQITDNVVSTFVVFASWQRSNNRFNLTNSPVSFLSLDQALTDLGPDPIVIGTATATIPLPASLPLLAGTLVLAAFLARRRPA